MWLVGQPHGDSETDYTGELRRAGEPGRDIAKPSTFIELAAWIDHAGSTDQSHAFGSGPLPCTR